MSHSIYLMGRSRYGDTYTGHRTETIASALAKFIRWRYAEQSQRYKDYLLEALFQAAGRSLGSFQFDGWTLELHNSNRPPTKR